MCYRRDIQTTVGGSQPSGLWLYIKQSSTTPFPLRQAFIYQSLSQILSACLLSGQGLLISLPEMLLCAPLTQI